MSFTSPQVNCPPALLPGPVEALREELRCLLIHPAITPERRQQAAPLLSQCLDVAKLRRWLELIVQECATWEDEALAAEETQTKSGPQRWGNYNF